MVALADLDRESWLAERLRQHGAWIFDGVTDRDERCKRARSAIQAHELAAVIAGRGRDGKPETYSEVFARVYSEKL